MSCRDQPPCCRGIACPGLLFSLSLLFLTLAPSLLHAASQSRPVFGEERFDRAGGNPDHYERPFSVPAYVAAPFTLHLVNGNPDGSSRVAVEDAVASGRVLVDGVEVIAPSAFSKTVATLDRTLTLAPGPHTLTVELASSPGSYLRLTITGTIALGDLSQPRTGHTATLLPDGRVLVTGGVSTGSGPEPLATTERFDGVTLQSTPLALQLLTARRDHQVTLLPDATLLVTGGTDALGPLATAEALRRDLSAADLLPAGLQSARAGHTATLLPDGRVLLLGGVDVSHFALTEGETFDARPDPLAVTGAGALYDPQAGTVTPLPDALQVPRTAHTATLLPSGLVLIAGGKNGDGDLASAELFDPATGHSTLLAATLTTPRAGHAAVLQPDGSVLLLGGRQGGAFLGSLEVWQPATQSFVPTPATLLVPRAAHTATRLPNGEILVAGGDGPSGVLAHTELVGPPAPDATPPSVLALSPAAGATLVPRNPLITVLFSEPLLVTRVTTATVTLTGPGGPVPGLVVPAEAGLLVVVSPGVRLESGTTYTLTLNGLTDGAGNALPPTTSSFTTFPAPTLTGFAPTSGPPGSAVTLTGSGFAVPTPAQLRAAFNGVPAVVTSVTATSLTALVPEAAQTGPLTVTTPGGTATSAQPFTVVRGPVLTALSPTSGPVGTVVTVSGQNFDPTPTNNQIRFNGVPAIVSVAGPTALTTTVPQGATTGFVTVTTPLGTGTSPSPFTVTGPAFTVSALPASLLVPVTGQAAIAVTLTGTGGFTTVATLAVSGVPPGAAAAFTVPALAAGQTALLAVATTGTTPAGSYPVTVTATGLAGGILTTRSATLLVQVQGAGETSLAGQVRDEDGQPVKGAVVTLGSLQAPTAQAVTDAGGNFLLQNPPAGADQLLFIDGGPASTPERNLPVIPYKVTVLAGQANRLGFTPSLHFQKTTGLVDISNSGVERTVTDPDLPGFQMTIPAGVTITGWDGQPNTQLSIRRVPIDRVPLPPPPPDRVGASAYMDYFGKPGGGTPSAPVPITFPNDLDLPPGTAVELWYYDEAPDGSRPNQMAQYGTGTVSADGARIVPDVDPTTGQPYGQPRFCCGYVEPLINRVTRANLLAASGGPGTGPEGKRGGEPVDLATGIFVLEKTDFVLPGRLPVAVTRYYRSQGPAAGPFGPGTSHAYQVQLLIQRDFRTLLLPDGRRLPFPLQPDGTFRNLGDPAMRGAVLTATGGGHRLRFKDGTLWTFNAPVLGTALGFLVGVSDRNGSTISLTRDSFNQNLLAITDAAGRPLTFTYNGASQVTQLTDPIGRAVRYDYDAAGRLALVHDPAGGVTRYTYDDRGQMLTITDARGLTFLTNEYDAAGRVVAQTQADGGRWAFAYTTSSGVVTQTVVTDPRGQTSTTRFSGRGYTLAETDAQGQTVQSARDPATNLRLATTDALGRTTRFAYDAAGNVTSITDPAGQVIRFEYEPTFNRLTKLTDALGQVTTFTYDANGNLLTTTDPTGAATSIAYNSFGQPIAVTDPLGQTTTFTYDDQGNLVTTTDPLGNHTQRAYDAVSRLIDLIDPKGRHTLFRYDDLNRVTEIADARQGITRFTYDPNGNLLEVQDAKGQTTTYTYDQMDRLATRTDALGREETYQYDAAGNLSQFTDRKGQVSTFAYDPLNRRTGAQYADGSTTTFTYDAVGRLAAAEDSTAGRIEFTYDPLDRLSQEVTPQGAVQYHYDALGRRTSLTANGLPPVLYQYDAASRLTQIAQGSLTVGLGYDAAGRRTTLTYPNGTSTSYGYDDASRLLTILHQGPAGVIESLTYTYDAAGNRLSLTRATAQASLFPEPIQAAYDAANEQIQFNSPAPNQTFDANGNLTADGINAYAWDARNRLVSISGPGVTASFTYDALGRRVSKTINGVTTDYLYDGHDIVAEIGGGAVGTTYVRSLNIDEPFVRQSASGNEYYHADALSSVLALTNDAGVVATTYSYEPFGRTTISGTSTNPFQFTGRENDGTGLYYYRRRYYGSILQRYLREDPLRLIGGTPNFYVYAENNPLKFVDPYGLYASPWHFILAFYAMISTGHDPIASMQTAIDSVILDFVESSQAPRNANWHAQREPDQSINRAVELSRRFIQQQLDQCRLGFALHTAEDEGIHKYEPYVEIGFNRQFLKHFIHDLFPLPSELSQSFQNDLEIINRYDKSRRKQQCP